MDRKLRKSTMAVHAFILSTQKAEAGVLFRVWWQFVWQRKFHVKTAKIETLSQKDKKLHPTSCLEIFLLLLSSNNFSVSGFTLISLIHLELIFMQGERWRSSFTLLQVDIHFSNHHLLKRLLFSPPICIFGIFVKNQVAVAVWVHTWIFYSNFINLCFCFWVRDHFS